MKSNILNTEWRLVNLTNICEPKQWKNLPSKKLLGQGFPVYGANGIIGYYSDYNHEKQTIAITCRGATCGNIHLTKPYSYINSNAMALDKINEVEYSLKFLYYSLKYRGLKEVISGSAQPQITREGLKKIKIPIPYKNGKPDLLTQKRIAKILSHTETLIAKRKKSIQMLDEFVKATFLEMFGDPVRNEKGWEKDILKNLATVKIGPFGSLLHKSDYVKNNIPLINPVHIVNNKIVVDNSFTISSKKAKELTSYRLKTGDIILARRGEIGRCAIVSENENNFICGTGSLFVRPHQDLFLPSFLLNVFLHPSLKNILNNKAKGITMKNLNSKIVENLVISVPPLPLQNQFAEIVEKTEALKKQFEQSLQELENLYGSLSQKAFKGELDLTR